MDEMKSLVSNCLIFVSQMLYRTDDSPLLQVAYVFDFNDIGSYLSKTILTSLYPRNHTDQTFSKIQTSTEPEGLDIDFVNESHSMNYDVFP